MNRLALLLPLVVGCAARPQLAPPSGPPPEYRFGCPDVVEVSFADRPEWDAVASVDVNGTLALGPAGKPQVSGRTPAESATEVAAAAGQPADRVSVRLLDPRAGRVYVTGPTNGWRQVVAYRGPEPAFDLIVRAGLVPPNAADLHDIYLVRGNVAAGGAAEVYRVTPTNGVTVKPADQLYIGETRRASFERLLPEFMKPLYRELVGLWPVSTGTTSNPAASVPR